MKEVDVLYDDNHIIVAIKKPGILSQEDITGKSDMLTLLKSYIKEKYDKKGNIYLGLIHRLDQRVGGVMVFGKSSKASSRLSNDIRNHMFDKKYFALVTGIVEGSGKLINFLEKKDNKAVESKAGKESVLFYKALNHIKINGNDFTFLDIELVTGRYNQIRFQLSSFGHPIINDYKYGYIGDDKKGELGLYCYNISFNHPVKKEKLSFSNVPNFTFWKELVNNEKK